MCFSFVRTANKMIFFVSSLNRSEIHGFDPHHTRSSQVKSQAMGLNNYLINFPRVINKGVGVVL